MQENIFNHHCPAGQFRDILFNVQGERVWEQPWQSNLILNGLRRLLAALVKGDPL